MQRRGRSGELAYNLRSSSNLSAMDLAGGGSSSIQRPINIDLNVIDEARPNDRFAPGRESSRHKRKNPSSSSSSSSTNSDANTNANTNNGNMIVSQDDFVRNTRARSNYYVIDLEEEDEQNTENIQNIQNVQMINEESEPEDPVADLIPNPIAFESVQNVLENNEEGNPNLERLQQTLTVDEERDGDSDNGSNGSDVDYSGLLRALVAVRERREGRGRVLTEIRHVLDSLRNSENVGNEDISFVHRVMSMARNNMFDRHRDMRLDVDNMSYEELLALEERIGNVNTGLSEEKVMSCLEQSSFVFPSGKKSDVLEPCCICQEEYEQGAETGKLGCGHDFHLGCIKQWLSHKNSCPICKTEALDSKP